MRSWSVERVPGSKECVEWLGMAGWGGMARRSEGRKRGRAGREEAVLGSGQERMEVWEGLFE
jgi:hypothetical protein